MRMECEAVAKVNLFLKVTGRRDDGYHELETLFWPFPVVADRLQVEFDAEPGVTLRSSDPEIPTDSRNLAVRAAERYAAAGGIAPAWKLVLDKNIPVAAGLGGGSSDAAAVLRLLNDRFRRLSETELKRIALELGADVPFFLNPVPAVATGVGEVITPLEGVFSPPDFLVLFPGFPVSAKWSYSHLDPRRIGPAEPGKPAALIAALRSGDAAGVASAWENDLEPPLFVKFPLLRLLRDELLAAGAAGVMISGSGPSLLAVFPPGGGAARAAAAIAAAHPENRQLRLFFFGRSFDDGR